MAHETTKTSVHHHRPVSVTLPPQVVSPTDVGHLVREINQLDEDLLQLSLRDPGTDVKMPKTTRLMDVLTEHNKLNLLKKTDRALIKQYLQLNLDQAPRLHFSFASDPPASFLEKLIIWLRRELHPHLLVTVGLQPSIGAGCVVRTTNKYFDFSLGKNLQQKRELLLSQFVPKE